MKTTPEAMRAAEKVCEYFRELPSDFAEDIAAIIDRDMAGWKPIKDAPMDGTTVLTLSECGVHEGSFYAGRYWHSLRGGGSAFMIHKPTHFRELPTPPPNQTPQ